MYTPEFNWLIAHPEEAEKYPGEYIAIVGESIVAHGKDFKAVLVAAESQTGKEPFIYKVPPADREIVV
ncbi:MAG: hypothetical protein HYV04_07830 [Deltaproteobacteria bacterium]|nr:hypothetical protein [Deltaproteobacteria bacterium]